MNLYGRQGFKRRPGRKVILSAFPTHIVPACADEAPDAEADPPKAQAALPPPPLALDLPLEADLGTVAVAFARAFADAYVVLRNFVPLLLLPRAAASGWEGLDRATDATPLAPLLPQAEADPLRALLPGAPCLALAGRGLDRNPAWWREGGQEDWVVHCACGTRDDDGERMLICDGCRAWHHWRCAGLPEDAELPPSWLCRACAKRAGQDD